MANLALAFEIVARDRASRTFKDVGSAADDAGKKGDGFGKKMGAGMKVAAVGLAGLAGASIVGLGRFVKDAAESARIGRLTEAVVKSTGGAAKITAAQVGDLATAISNKTGADDEAIQSGANMLLTFTNVRNEAGKGNDVFNQATQTITDMSAALGTDTKASALQLGKALNDPIKGVTALSKVGVSFTQQQKDQIKTLVKSGDTLGAQKIILNELGKEFGGAAEAASDPMSRLQVIAGNLGEKVGGYLLPIVGNFAKWVGEKAIPAVEGWVDEMGPKLAPIMENARRFIGQVTEKVKGFITEFQNGTGAGGKLRESLAKVGDVVKSLTQWFSDNQGIIKTLIVSVLAGVVAWNAWRAGVATVTAVTKGYAIAQGVLNTVMKANPIGIVITLIAALAAGLIYAYQTNEKFRAYVMLAWAMVKIGALTLAKVAISAFQGLADMFMTVVQTLLDGAAKAFGWVPGLGPKLQTAATEFGTFKKSANEQLNAIKDDIDVQVSTAQAEADLENFRIALLGANWTVSIDAIFKGAADAARGGGSGGAYGGGSGGGSGLGRPVPQRIGTGWNGYPGHKGVDFLTPFGTPVVAAMAGQVIRDGWDTGGFGVHIRTRDDDGDYTILGHLSKELVSVGQRISKGQLIGYTGSTGNSSGPHLHMERRHALGPESAYNFAGALARNKGGPVWPGGMFAVGDNKDGSWNPTTELFVPKTAGRIYNQDQINVGGGGREVHIHYSGVGMSPRDLVQEAYREERKDAALHRNYGD